MDKQTTPTNTERLINDFLSTERAGQSSMRFSVGKYTGNGPSVVAALKRRGFCVTHVPGGAYEMQRMKTS